MLIKEKIVVNNTVCMIIIKILPWDSGQVLIGEICFRLKIQQKKFLEDVLLSRGDKVMNHCLQSHQFDVKVFVKNRRSFPINSTSNGGVIADNQTVYICFDQSYKRIWLPPPLWQSQEPPHFLNMVKAGLSGFLSLLQFQFTRPITELLYFFLLTPPKLI